MSNKPVPRVTYSFPLFFKCFLFISIYLLPFLSWAQGGTGAIEEIVIEENATSHQEDHASIDRTFAENKVTLRVQDHGSIEGVVIEDDTTKTPIPFANVFLNNTMIGTTANDQGYFVLPNVPNGKYTITASSVGYEYSSVEVQVNGTNAIVEIPLRLEATKLQEVEVKWNRAEYAKQLKVFKQLFLGTTANAAECEIKNITDVDFVYDKEKKVLTATCDKPLEIENKALGYHVTYLLDQFRIDYKIGYCFMAGIPRFTNLKPKNTKQMAQWEAERNRAYYGSINHFMRSLKSEQLKENGFSVFALTHRLPPNKAPSQVLVDDSIYFQREIHEAELLNARHPQKYILKIVYEKEQPETGFVSINKGLSPGEMSYLRYTKPGLVVYENGYYEDALSYYIEGYISWSNKIADMVPMEYQPDDPQRSGTELKEETTESLLLSDSAH